MKKRRITDLSMEEMAVLAAEAGRKAVAESFRLGLPVTGTKDGRIVKTYPDGREVVLRDLPFMPNVGPGWRPIVDRLIEALAQLPAPPEILEIKNKWGELRVYLMSYRREEEDLLKEAEEEASRTCEMCGQPGKLRENLPWLQVLCDRHYEDRQ